MGKPLSEDAKQKIRDAFARKREQKLLGITPVAEEKKTHSNMIYVDEHDKEQLIEMGRQVQEGKIRRCGYATGSHMYMKI